jgi:hypothetical protein
LEVFCAKNEYVGELEDGLGLKPPQSLSNAEAFEKHDPAMTQKKKAPEEILLRPLN